MNSLKLEEDLLRFDLEADTVEDDMGYEIVASQPDLDANTDDDDESGYEDKAISGGRRSLTLRDKEPAMQAAPEKPQLSPWEVCYQVNLSIQKKITGPWQCVACSRKGFAKSPEYRSNFATVVAACPDGHKDHLSSSNTMETMIACSRCDEDFALRVSQQTVKCFHPTCLRMLVVDLELVKWANEGENWQDTVNQYAQAFGIWDDA